MILKKRTHQDLILTHFSKHNCPKCSHRLSVIEVSEITNAKSPPKDEYAYSHADPTLFGDVEFTWDEFKCNNCGFQITPKVLRKIEREKRNIEKEKIKQMKQKQKLKINHNKTK